MAQRGGRIAGNARRELEKETGTPVVTAENAQTLQQLVTGAVEDSAALAEGSENRLREQTDQRNDL